MIEAASFRKVENPHGFEQAQGAEPVGIGCIFGRLETDQDMALRGEIIDLVGLRFLDQADQIGRIRDIAAVVQKEAQIRVMRVLIEMIDAVGVDERGAALHAVNDIAFLDQQFGQIGAVLAGYAGNQCDFWRAHSAQCPLCFRNKKGVLVALQAWHRLACVASRTST